MIDYLDGFFGVAFVGPERVRFVGFVVTFFTLGGRGPISTAVTSREAFRGDNIANVRHTQVEGEVSDERREKTSDTRREGSFRDFRRSEPRDAGSRGWERKVSADRTGVEGCGFGGEFGMVYIAGLRVKLSNFKLQYRYVQNNQFIVSKKKKKKVSLGGATLRANLLPCCDLAWIIIDCSRARENY